MQIKYFEYRLSLILEQWKKNNLKKGDDYSVISVDPLKDIVIFKIYDRDEKESK